MKRRVILSIILMSLLLFVFYNLITSAEAGKKVTLEDKITQLLAKQDQILTKLDNIKEELIKIKIRISRKL